MIPDRHWRTVAAFLAVILIAVAVVTWEDHRVDRAARAVARAEVKATQAQRENALQNRIRRDLILVFCNQINALNERIRVTVRVDRAQFRLALTNIGIDPDSPQGRSLFRQAIDREKDVEDRFRSLACLNLPGA
jgi:hypothetical protein